MMGDSKCPFCQIVNGQMGSIVWQNDLFCAFRDIQPKAKTHILIVPKEHISNLDDFNESKLAAGLISAVKEIENQLKLTAGYRLILNNKPGGGQVIAHLHLHLLSGSD